MKYESFDSILVRLKGCVQAKLELSAIRFDSILVRLKGVPMGYASLTSFFVSIPYWFD